MTPLTSALLFSLAVIVLGFVLRAVTRTPMSKYDIGCAYLAACAFIPPLFIMLVLWLTRADLGNM